MGTHWLVCHPDTPPNSVDSVQVEVARGDYNELVAVFTATSSDGLIKVPAPVRYASRADELWKTTCFEAFIMREDATGYYELNFAPSTAWAAYAFQSYRSGMSNVEIEPPHFDVDLEQCVLKVTIATDAGALEGLPAVGSWTLALSAVIEETDGTKSYWALAHPPGNPDFHHPACFALTLPPPSKP